MYYKLNSFVFVRNVNNYMQIIDKRTDDELIGDFNSYLFAKHLDYAFRHIDVITEKICMEFWGNVDFGVVKNDTIHFLDRLVDFGLVTKSLQTECVDNHIDNKLIRHNILLPKDELEKFQSLKRQNPCLQNIVVEITQKCNERCLHCYIPHENKNSVMSDKDFYNIVDMCSEIKTIVNFRLTGGECMSHPSFKHYIKYVKERGFALILLTNLTLLDDDIIKILKTGTLSQVQVSLFALDPNVHDRITTIPGSLNRTLKNIERLKSAGIPVAIATQAMEINKNSIDELYKYAKNNGFDLRCDWTIIAKEDRNNNNLSHRICDLTTYKNLCKLRLKYMEGYKDDVSKELSRTPKSEITHLCNAGTNGLYIDTNLFVHPCPGWDLTVGNLKQESLSHIWNYSENLQKVRDVVLKDFPKCVRCDIRNLCSICMAQADLENTAHDFKFEMPEYVCSMYKVIYDTIQDEVFLKSDE